jgi:hypothetical protein
MSASDRKCVAQNMKSEAGLVQPPQMDAFVQTITPESLVIGQVAITSDDNIWLKILCVVNLI